MRSRGNGVPRWSPGNAMVQVRLLLLLIKLWEDSGRDNQNTYDYTSLCPLFLLGITISPEHICIFPTHVHIIWLSACLQILVLLCIIYYLCIWYFFPTFRWSMFPFYLYYPVPKSPQSPRFWNKQNYRKINELGFSRPFPFSLESKGCYPENTSVPQRILYQIWVQVIMIILITVSSLFSISCSLYFLHWGKDFPHERTIL